jgi:hypothetical protein
MLLFAAAHYSMYFFMIERFKVCGHQVFRPDVVRYVPLNWWKVARSARLSCLACLWPHGAASILCWIAHMEQLSPFGCVANTISFPAELTRK